MYRDGGTFCQVGGLTSSDFKSGGGGGLKKEQLRGR